MNHYEEIAWTHRHSLLAGRTIGFPQHTPGPGSYNPVLQSLNLQQYKARTSLMLVAVQYQHLIN